MRNLNYIAIEGPIGVGKTSLAKLLSKRLSAKLILEKFEDNPFLSEFYNDPARFAFQTQLFFLLQRYQQQHDIRQIDMFHNLLISDYMFIKDRLFASLNLDDKEMNLYDSIANIMERNIINPDLIIYLQAKTNVLISRIQNRNRDFEQKIDAEYLHRLNLTYDKWIKGISDIPVLVIDTNEFNIFEDSEKLKDIFQQIELNLSESKS